MAFLQEALDDPTAAPCGRCDVCAGPWYSSDVPEGAAQAASAVLDRPGVELAPRAQWPTGADRLGVEVKGKIRSESTRLNSSHANISYAVFCLKKKKKKQSTLSNRTTHPMT